MVLAVHIAIAVSSVIYSAFLLAAPSNKRFKFTYFMVGLTILSGTILVIRQPAQMTRACLTGIFFIGAVCAVIVAAKHKLASETKEMDRNFRNPEGKE